MKKEIKIGDVYFENEILKVTYTESYYHGHFAYLVDFLGNTCTHHCLEEHIKETAAGVVAESFGTNEENYLNYKNYRNKKKRKKLSVCVCSYTYI